VLDGLPFDPFVDAFFRHGSSYLPGSARDTLLIGGFLWSLYKWERQRIATRANAAELRQLKLLIRAPMSEFIPSPNYWKGRLGRAIKFVVIHSMAGNMEPSIREFQNPAREASAHWLIGLDGREVQMVDESNTAWHSGVKGLYLLQHPLSVFNNQDSVGIETEGGTFGGSTTLFRNPGFDTCARRVATIHYVYKLGRPSRSTVKMHREVAPTACPTGFNPDIQALVDAAAAEYDKLVSPPPADPVVPTPPSPPEENPQSSVRRDERLAGQTYRAKVNVNLRYGGNTEQGIIRTIKQGEVVTLSGNVSDESEYGTWAEVKEGGWVALKFFEAYAILLVKKTFVVGSVNLMVRPDPNTSKPAIRKLAAGSSQTYIDKVSGQSIAGNTTWLKLTEGEYSSAAGAKTINN